MISCKMVWWSREDGWWCFFAHVSQWSMGILLVVRRCRCTVNCAVRRVMVLFGEWCVCEWRWVLVQRWVVVRRWIFEVVWRAHLTHRGPAHTTTARQITVIHPHTVEHHQTVVVCVTVVIPIDLHVKNHRTTIRSAAACRTLCIPTPRIVISTRL